MCVGFFVDVKLYPADAYMTGNLFFSTLLSHYRTNSLEPQIPTVPRLSHHRAAKLSSNCNTVTERILTEIGGDSFATEHESQQQRVHQPRPRVSLVHRQPQVRARKRPHVVVLCVRCTSFRRRAPAKSACKIIAIGYQTLGSRRNVQSNLDLTKPTVL